MLATRLAVGKPAFRYHSIKTRSKYDGASTVGRATVGGQQNDNITGLDLFSVLSASLFACDYTTF